jgi:protein-tyrosine-phosphatase
MLTHRAVRITPEMIQATDTLFIMEPYHEERLLSLVPGSKDKIFYLRSFSGNNDSSLTIDDPYGSSIHVYNECFHLIERCVKNLLSEIDKQTQKK